MSTIPAVTAYLKTHLDALSSTYVKTVLKGRNEKNTGFPYVRFYLVDYGDDLISGGGGTASDHFVEVRYMVEVVGELASGKTAPKKEDDFQNAVETVVAKLEEEWKVGGNDVVTAIVGQGAREEQWDHGNCVVLPLLVTIRTFRQYT